MTELLEFRFLFHADRRNPSLERDQICALAEGYVRANEMAIAYNPGAFPRNIEQWALEYIAPVRCRSPHPCQRVLGAGPLRSDGKETCLGLACLHASLLRYFDGDRGAFVEIVPRRGRYGPVSGVWHALVVTGRGYQLDTQSIVEQRVGMVAGWK